MVKAISISPRAETAPFWLREYIENETLHTPAFRSHALGSLSAASVLESLKSSLDAHLCNQLDGIVELCQNILPVSGNMLELHFNRDEAWFDFAYRINKDYDAPLLKPALLPETLLPFLQDDSDQLFQKHRHCFRYGIENVCVEYDFPFESPPAVFFDLHGDKEFMPGRTSESLKELCSAFQQPVDEELAVFFARIKSAGLHVVYSGFMFSRKGTSIRFTIEGVMFDTFTKTIRLLGWKGDYDALKKLQHTYLEPDQRLVLCVDFDQGLGNKIGIEVHSPDWEPILKKLYANGICNEKQHDLLKSWSGKTALSNPLSMALSPLHQRTINCLFRRLNHFKFMLGKDTFNTKAYLYYCF